MCAWTQRSCALETILYTNSREASGWRTSLNISRSQHLLITSDSCAWVSKIFITSRVLLLAVETERTTRFTAPKMQLAVLFKDSSTKVLSLSERWVLFNLPTETNQRLVDFHCPFNARVSSVVITPFSISILTSESSGRRLSRPQWLINRSGRRNGCI